jgi:HSP20 family molecular chaperone IbpA
MAKKTQAPVSESEGRAVAQPEKTRTALVITPAADIEEKPDGIVMELDMPGADADSINVTFEKPTLSVYAQGRSTRPSGYALSHGEYNDSDYERSFTVSTLIDAGKIDASYTAGVLRLFLPFAKEAQARTIKVKMG